MTISLTEIELVRLRQNLEERLTVFLREEIERRFAPWYDQLAAQMRELVGKRAKQIAEMEAGANLKMFVENEIKARIGYQIERSFSEIEAAVRRAQRQSSNERLTAIESRLRKHTGEIRSLTARTLEQEIRRKRSKGRAKQSGTPDLALTIDDLVLTIRSHNALKADNIETLGELVKKQEWELLRIPNFGSKSLKEIKTCLAELGLHLGMDDAP